MSERDPRVDPRPGDVVTKAGARRRVSGFNGTEVVFWFWFDNLARSPGRNLVFLRSWRNWCRGAEVVSVAAAGTEGA